MARLVLLWDCYRKLDRNYCIPRRIATNRSILLLALRPVSAVVHPVILVHFLYLEYTLYVFLISNYTLYVRLLIALGVYRVRYVNISSHRATTNAQNKALEDRTLFRGTSAYARTTDTDRSTYFYLIFETYTCYQFLFSSVTVRCGLLQIGDVIRHQLQDQFEPIQKSSKSKKSYLLVSFGLYGSRVQYNTTTTATATAVPGT
jgi:hypothetical protein